MTTHLELGTISPANKCQRGSEDRGSLLSILDEQATVSVQQAAFEALPSALQREQVAQPEQTAPVNSNYPIVVPECVVLDASGVSNTMAVPASGNVCVILDRPPSREETHARLQQLVADEEEFRRSKESSEKTMGIMWQTA